MCESLIDALTFWNHGFRNVTTSYGTSGFTDGIMGALKDSNIKRVLIAYDRDAAGDKAALELSVKLNAENIDTYRVQFPKGSDANDYSILKSESAAIQIDGASQRLAQVIRKAIWLGKGAEPARTASSIETNELSQTSLAVKGENLPSLTANPHIS